VRFASGVGIPGSYFSHHGNLMGMGIDMVLFGNDKKWDFLHRKGREWEVKPSPATDLSLVIRA